MGVVRTKSRIRPFPRQYRDSVTNRFMMNDWFPGQVVCSGMTPAGRIDEQAASTTTL
ncbi:hypothetical protein AB395_00001176 [Sinorhizobium fredii CCBAU 45436]|nr:hypothetical protein AB395_00001176 [Sinorhizobium fredii CCBAU 45436]AWM24648.1 hypothetical protein AOX55_00001381 [Sinorhizobium fredii CCBAU 25509]